MGGGAAHKDHSQGPEGAGRAAPSGSHVMKDYATRSEKARVTAAVRLETFNRV